MIDNEKFLIKSISELKNLENTFKKIREEYEKKLERLRIENG